MAHIAAISSTEIIVYVIAAFAYYLFFRKMSASMKGPSPIEIPGRVIAQASQEVVATVRELVLKTFAKAEGHRFVDIDIYNGHVYPADVAEAVPLEESLALVVGQSYTLGVAIRLNRKGIESQLRAKREVENPRKDKETLTLEIVVSTYGPNASAIKLEQTVAQITWPFDADSTEALFRFELNQNRLQKAWTNEFEIRIHFRKDFLDVVRMTVPVVATRGVKKRVRLPREFKARRLSWPQKADVLACLPVDTSERALSIHISMEGSRYRFQFLLRRDDGRLMLLPFVRNFSNGDLEMLLRRIRDFWTKLAVTTYANKITPNARSTFKGHNETLVSFGQEAWRLLFGDAVGDRTGASEAVGDLLSRTPFLPGSLIQIVYAPEVIGFVFPWNLVYPPAAEEDVAVNDPFRFWGARYQIEQVQEGSLNDGLTTEPVEIAVTLDSQFGDAQLQATMFESLQREFVGKLRISELINNSKKLFAELSRGPSSHIYYFFCHGYAPRAGALIAPDRVNELKKIVDDLPEKERAAWEYHTRLISTEESEAWIYIGDSKIRLSKLAEKSFFFFQQGKPFRKPIVFLNMCQSVDLPPTMTTGFVRLFLNRNAVAVIGTECVMSAVFAHQFSDAFFRAVLSGKDVGSALYEARARFLHPEVRNPLGLAYTLYGRGTTRVGNRPVSREAENDSANVR
jgi:hypothetical protein